MPSHSAALSYSEPDIVTILILASFLLLSNVVNWLLDRIVYCGLVGQIFIGVAYGVPGADWLSASVQNSIMQLGYLGLILIVYEGGLSTNLKTLRANLFLSASVAVIGISVPIGLSFILRKLLDIDPLQAFAAGAALCSTSLGTTFTVLSTSQLTESRLGVILTSAAMMDDVVGLIMVQVITTLGQSPSIGVATIVRPIGVSLAFAVLLPLFCSYVVKPLATSYKPRMTQSQSRIAKWLQTTRCALVVQTLFLIAMVTGSSYAGTSNLFAAYLTGVCVTWWERLECNLPAPPQPLSTPSPQPSVEDSSSKTASTPAETASKSAETPPETTEPSPKPSESTPPIHESPTIYDLYYAPAVNTILKPFFFASIGFSIPITKLFAGPVIWRGLVYAILMLIGKLLCGICLVRIPLPTSFLTTSRSILATISKHVSRCWRSRGAQTVSSKRSKKSKTAQPQQSMTPTRQPSSTPAQPLSLYPAAILGSAMVARGEIGFLISAVAESNGVFSKRGTSPGSNSTTNDGTSELFLVVTWAILACTMLGPITVGLLVRRVRRLQATERQQASGRPDPLDVWGVIEIRS